MSLGALEMYYLARIRGRIPFIFARQIRGLAPFYFPGQYKHPIYCVWIVTSNLVSETNRQKVIPLRIL